MRKLILAILLLTATAWANVAITTTALPAGMTGTAYSATITTRGGCLPMAWTWGGLPPGLAAVAGNKTRTLVIAGTPTTVGTYDFGVTVTGCGGHSATEQYSVTVTTPTAHSVSLTWNVDTDAVSYNIYRGTVSGTYALLASAITATSYDDTAIEDGETYFYVATGVNSVGQESAYSNMTEAVIP